MLLRVPVFPRPGLAGDGDAVHHAQPDLGGRPLGGGRGLVTHGEVVAHDEVPGLVLKYQRKFAIFGRMCLLAMEAPITMISSMPVYNSCL